MYGETLNMGGEFGGDPTVDQITLIAIFLPILIAFAVLYLRASIRRRKRDH